MNTFTTGIRGKIGMAALLLALTSAVPAQAAGSGESPPQQTAEQTQQTGEPDPSSPLKVTAIDFGWEGWGDGTMIESGGECMLMDTFMPDCRDDLMEFLVDNGYTEFSIYLSHYHADHFCSIRPLMWDDRFTITGVYLPDDGYLWPTDEDYGAEIGWFMDVDNGIRELAAEMDIPLTVLHPGDSFMVGDAKVEILYGTTYVNDDHDRSYINNNSLVARITGGGIRYLTCGDIEEIVEGRILDEGIDVSADLYKMSHHGAYSSNTWSFLEAVNPSFAYFNSMEDSPDAFAAEWAEEPVSNMMQFANVHSSRYNGDITYTARDGVITVKAERNTNSKIQVFKADSGVGFCMTFQQFNDAQSPMITDKMRAAGEAAAAGHGLIPAIYR